jgi:hypothetical protein
LRHPVHSANNYLIEFAYSKHITSFQDRKLRSSNVTNDLHVLHPPCYFRRLWETEKEYLWRWSTLQWYKTVRSFVKMVTSFRSLNRVASWIYLLSVYVPLYTLEPAYWMLLNCARTVSLFQYSACIIRETAWAVINVFSERGHPAGMWLGPCSVWPLSINCLYVRIVAVSDVACSDTGVSGTLAIWLEPVTQTCFLRESGYLIRRRDEQHAVWCGVGICFCLLAYSSLLP